MAVAFNHLTTAKSEVDGTTFSTASISPTANALILVMVSAVRGDSINYADPTLAGCGLTWVAIGTVQVDVGPSSMRGGTLFRGLGTPSPGALTFTYGVSHESCAWSVAEATGVDTTGTNGSGAVVQVVTAVGVGTTPAVTLAAFGSADNATYAGVATGGGTISSAGTGFTLLGTTASVTPSVVGVGSQYQLANDTSVNMTIGSDDWGIIGVEVKAAAGVTHNAAIALPTTATLSTKGLMTYAGASALPASGALAAKATATYPATSTLAGAATLAANGGVTYAAVQVLAGSATLTANALLTLAGITALTGSATIAPVPLITLGALAAVTGTATFAGAGTVDTGTSVAALTATATLAPFAKLTLGGQAAFTGTGVLAASPLLTLGGVVALTGSATVAAASQMTMGGSAALPGTVTLAPSASQTLAAAATIVGMVALLAAGSSDGLERPLGFRLKRGVGRLG